MQLINFYWDLRISLLNYFSLLCVLYVGCSYFTVCSSPKSFALMFY